MAADLDAFRLIPETANDVDLLNAFLDEVGGSESSLWTLSKWSDDHQRPFFNCKALNCFQDSGFNVYRVRPLKGRLRKYRILYAFNAPHNEFHLLAVVRKRPETLPVGSIEGTYYNYEEGHPISQRISDEYERRGFAKI